MTRQAEHPEGREPVPDEVRARVRALVRQFNGHRSFYQSPDYKEDQLCREFLDPLFAALGWDMENRAGLAPEWREVIREDTQRTGEGVKAPDYAFKAGRERDFFVEAKKPSVDLKLDPAPAYQLRRYGWNAKMPVSILSDFQEFALYDCREKPRAGAKASEHRLEYFTCDELEEKLPFLWNTFTKRAIQRGSLARYAHGRKGKRGTAPVDADFLATLEDWRGELARHLAVRNPELIEDEADLNFAVQAILDRLIFLRMAEDRRIEPPAQLLGIVNHSDVYGAFMELCRKADAGYNSGLFDFASDRLTPKLVLDSKVLKGIIEQLYYPKSDYEFRYFPHDLLGSVYERFLGKVIRLTAGHRAKVEEKPEVKKAGGVYYTPQYIVDYIVKQTVGEAVKGKSPKEIAKLRILDPACGSGSFLLGAYDFLLNWHRDWYAANEPEKHPKAVRKTGDSWLLTVAERKRILTAHLHGVDLDRQAVEVTKLSLLLKVLEGADRDTLQAQQTLFGPRERYLPNLDQNIKCGNSLVSPADLSGMLLKDDDLHQRLNPFDWKNEFPEAMKSCGFDIVIGNPPYIRNRELDDDTKSILLKSFEVASGQYDIYQLFFEQGIKQLREGGILGFITSNKYTVASYGRSLREYILKHCLILELIDVSNIDVFKDASTYPYISCVQKSKTIDANNQIRHLRADDELDLVSPIYSTIPQSAFVNDQDKCFVIKTLPQFFSSIESISVKMGTITTIKETIHTGNVRDKLVVDKYVDNKCKKLLAGRDCHRYSFEWSGKYLRYDQTLINKNKGDYANLAARKYFEEPKILLREIADKIECCYDAEKYYTLNKVYSVQLINDACSYEYLLGLLNSKLLSYYFRMRFEEAHVRGGYLQFKKQYTSQLPIRLANDKVKSEREARDKIIALVEKQLTLHPRLAAAKTPRDQETLDRQIAAADAEIDRLVYQLYGLTEEEIRIVEGNS